MFCLEICRLIIIFQSNFIKCTKFADDARMIVHSHMDHGMNKCNFLFVYRYGTKVLITCLDYDPFLMQTSGLTIHATRIFRWKVYVRFQFTNLCNFT